MHFLNTLIPEKTSTYTPVPHIDIINGIKAKIGGTNFTEKYKQNGDGSVVVGTFTLQENTQINGQISFINSYNKRTKLGIITGAETFVCTNGMAIGELVQLRKHTGVVPLDDFIVKGLENLQKDHVEVIKLMEQWKWITMSKKDMAELTGRLFIEDRVLSTSELTKLRKEISTPSYNYDAPEDSLYSFYQHCTHAIKEVHPTRFINTHKKIKERLELSYY